MTQSIIITGAGRGVGKATAEAFFAAGWRVGLIGRNADTLEDVARGQENALVLPCDVTDEAAVDAAFDKAVAAWGRIDALFNNAGVSLKGAPIDEMDVNAWREVIDINVTGSFICARAAFARMRKQDPQGGRIINNGSVSAYVPRWIGLTMTLGGRRLRCMHILAAAGHSLCLWHRHFAFPSL